MYETELQRRQRFHEIKWHLHRVNVQFDNVFGRTENLYTLVGLYLLEFANHISLVAPPEEGFHRAYLHNQARIDQALGIS